MTALFLFIPVFSSNYLGFNISPHLPAFQNLGLGVFESRGQAPPSIPVANLDLDLDQGVDVEMDSVSDLDSSSSSSDSSSNSDSSDGTSDSNSGDAPIPPSTVIQDQTLLTRAIKPLPARAKGRNPRNLQGTANPNTRPEIVVLSDNNEVDRSTSP